MGGFRIERIRRDKPIIHTEIGQFEDHWFSCEYFLRDGGIMRKNWITIKTKYFCLKGGICGQLGGLYERQKEMRINQDIMIKKFGKMISPVIKQKGHDIRLNHHFKHPSL